MPKLTPIINSQNQTIGYYFNCPGCGDSHAPCVRPYVCDNGASWEFNGDLERPTFRPSILSRVEKTEGGVKVCHLYVTDGKLHFLSDCTHKMAGKIVEMIDEK